MLSVKAHLQGAYFQLSRLHVTVLRHYPDVNKKHSGKDSTQMFQLHHVVFISRALPRTEILEMQSSQDKLLGEYKDCFYLGLYTLAAII